MATTTATGNGEVRLREKKVPSSKPNGRTTHIDEIKSLSTPTAGSTAEETSNGDTITDLPSSKTSTSTFEHAFFLGLTIDDALKSTENRLELFYNACKYNHLDLVKRIVDDKSVNINEPFHNDYPLCIAR